MVVQRFLSFPDDEFQGHGDGGKHNKGLLSGEDRLAFDLVLPCFICCKLCIICATHLSR